MTGPASRTIAGEHRMEERTSIFGDVESFLDDTPHVGKERPGARRSLRSSFASMMLGGPAGKTANLQLTTECNKPLRPGSGRGAENGAADEEPHRPAMQSPINHKLSKTGSGWPTESSRALAKRALRLLRVDCAGTYRSRFLGPSTPPRLRMTRSMRCVWSGLVGLP